MHLIKKPLPFKRLTSRRINIPELAWRCHLRPSMPTLTPPPNNLSQKPRISMAGPHRNPETKEVRGAGPTTPGEKRNSLRDGKQQSEEEGWIGENIRALSLHLHVCMWIHVLSAAGGYLLVHWVSGASVSARRYPCMRHAHTEAPLTVVWLNLGQLTHCPSVPDLNWPTGQAGGGGGSKWRQITHDTAQALQTGRVPDGPGSGWIHTSCFSGWLCEGWLQTELHNKGSELTTITLIYIGQWIHTHIGMWPITGLIWSYLKNKIKQGLLT